MQQRTQPDAGPSTAPLVYPARAAAAAASGPFSTDRPPSPTSSLRSRNGKHKADPPTDDDATLDPAATGAAPPPPPPAAPASAPRNRKKWRGLVFELENRGSVARDHLASERTFLAWLRTSLGLASIGIAITQLFRLPSTTTTSSTPSSPSSSSSAAASALSSALAALTSSNPALAPLVPILEAQQAQIAATERSARDSTRYRHLGKPIGGTFIMLALVFLLLGIHRYFTIQGALMREPSQFPPSRRSVGFGAAGVAALILASFVAILATK
ncbi:hypothetical protein JCM9279_005867 [Rhodotorula babjevae]